ncbi:hypothetical protein CSE45_0400 [Citreicella sp. SE45]|nr:hypothetical protein CSE45_0400 [Citreicella sp. SE45]
MLHDGRMAGLVKLHHSDGQPGERQQRAERGPLLWHVGRYWTFDVGFDE